jgi:glycosyltransferase involved in cell wall biosynthesis
MVRDHWQLDSRYVPFPIRLQTLVPPKTLAAGEPARAVWVGRLHPQKDPELAVRAVEAARRHYEIVLEMYGDGMLRAELDELARDRPWLVLHGERTWEEVQELQAGGHFCLLSSRNEATCLAALEPLSRGVPVVATGVGDIGQHLGEELARFATPPDDPEALGAAMVELCQNYKVYAAAFVANAERLRHHHREGPETLSALVDELVPPAVGKEPRVVDISAAGDAARPVSRKGAAKPPVVRGS